MTQTIDEYRAKNWGCRGSCGHCGDPIILADTESWRIKLCFDCWQAAGEPEVEPGIVVGNEPK